MRAPIMRVRSSPPRLMRRSPLLLAAIAAALAVIAPAVARAQGTLSGQGFGYPPGGLSTRALGQGGGNAEADPGSAVNPAALALWGRAGFMFNYGPEFRTVDASGRSDRTTVSRFPLIAAATPVGEHFTVGVSAATLLDRTFSTQASTKQVLSGGETVTTTSFYSSDGAAEDLRGALAWAPGHGISVGVGLHAFTGENRTHLGLSLVERIVNAHGGRVTVSSRPAAGSAFTITLPAAAPEARLSPVAGDLGAPAHAPTHQ